MPARRPSVHPRLRNLPVTDALRQRFAWPLAGLLERPIATRHDLLADERMRHERASALESKLPGLADMADAAAQAEAISEHDLRELSFRLNAVLPPVTSEAAVEAEADKIITACRSNSREKPGARLTLLLLALAEARGAVPDRVMDALAAALGISDRDLAPRVGRAVDWIDAPEAVALRAIQRLAGLKGKQAQQGELRGVRLAIYDLVNWYRQKGWATSPRTINALACHVGLVDPRTAGIDWPLLGTVTVGHDPRNVSMDADHIAANGGGRLREALLGSWVSEVRVRRNTKVHDAVIGQSRSAPRHAEARRSPATSRRRPSGCASCRWPSWSNWRV